MQRRVIVVSMIAVRSTCLMLGSIDNVVDVVNIERAAVVGIKTVFFTRCLRQHLILFDNLLFHGNLLAHMTIGSLATFNLVLIATVKRSKELRIGFLKLGHA